MANNHMLYFKDPNGDWKSIPGLYTEIYDAYVAYCQEHSITNIATQEEYYAILGTLDELVSDLTSSDQVAELIEQLQAGLLTTEHGGLGASIDQLPSGESYETISAYLADNTNVYSLISELDTGKLNKTAMSKGTTAPTSSTEGNYYFQYEE